VELDLSPAGLVQFALTRKQPQGGGEDWENFKARHGQVCVCVCLLQGGVYVAWCSYFAWFRWEWAACSGWLHGMQKSPITPSLLRASSLALPSI